MVNVVRQLVRSEGMAPVLVGHSSGGVTLNRILQVLASADGTVPRLPIAFTLGMGALLRWAPGFPGYTVAIPRLGLVQASVHALTGYRIAGDPFTSIMCFGDYRAPWAALMRRPGCATSCCRCWRITSTPSRSMDTPISPRDAPGSTATSRTPPAPLPEAAGLDLTNLAHAADL